MFLTLSRGVFTLSKEVESVLGAPLRLGTAPSADCTGVVGWGHRGTSEKARTLAAEVGLPYIALEDAFLRSVHAGPRERPLGLIQDRSGIYYDARQPSDLEKIIAGEDFPHAELVRARKGMARLRDLRLSKYNEVAYLPPEEISLPARDSARRVLVVDQTAGDASITGALADASTFQKMLRAAIAENPGAEVVVKLHPETVTGRKAGHLVEAAREGDLRVLASPLNPWTLIEACETVYVVSSQFGFEALTAGRRVVCFGAPFYAGWGLTDDRTAITRRRGGVSVEQIFAAMHFRYATYMDPRGQRVIPFEEAVELLAGLRDEYMRTGHMPRWALMPGGWWRDAVRWGASFQRRLESSVIWPNVLRSRTKRK